MKNKNISESRRDFLKKSALLGGAAIVGSQFTGLLGNKAVAATTGKPLTPEDLAELSKPENSIQTSCLQCNTGCSIKAKIQDGVAVKIDGNPVSIFNFRPPMPYKTSVTDIAYNDGHICPKGQAGIQSAYDAYRIKDVLKRSGKRGENKWVTIPFDQAVTEIVNGGKLFSNVSGEENRTVEGLKSLLVFSAKDKELVKKISESLAHIKHEKGEAKAKAIEHFKHEFSEHLDKFIDPNHPDFGFKNNQLSFIWGRLKGGRSEFIKRFTSESFGSVNAHGHTTVCQGSLYFTGKAMSEQYGYDEKGKKVTWVNGDKFYWQADTANAKFIIFAGSAVIEGGYGPPLRAAQIVDNIDNGSLKIAVIDPRYSKLAAKAVKWLPVKPGTDGAYIQAMIRWIIENKKYNEKFLSGANKAAAEANKEASWCNASWLVKFEGEKDSEKPTGFLRASEAGLAGEVKTLKKKKNKLVTDDYGLPVLDDKGKPKTVTEENAVYDNQGFEVTYMYDYMVCLQNGKLVRVDPNSSKEAVHGDLTGEITVSIKNKEGQKVDVVCKPAFEVIKKEAFSKSIDEWAAICDIPAQSIIELAQEFTSYGTKAVFDMHRGMSQHTNGYYNVMAGYVLNLLIGNFDHKGGVVKGSAYGFIGDKDGQPFDLKKNPGKIDSLGINTIRAGYKYEDSTLWDESKGKDNYPAKRQWYYISSDIYQEIYPSIQDQYPYGTKILISYMSSAPYSLPGGHKVIDVLVDTEKLPLHIASDIYVGESSMYADYIFPDTSYLERWEFHGTHPTSCVKQQPVRQPAIGQLTGTVKVFGIDHPLNLEAMLLAFAEKLELKGFGADAFGKGLDLKHQDDFYIRAVANLASGEKWGDEVPDADDNEVEIFTKARRFLPKELFDINRWKKITGEKLWKKVVYVLNRGGRFQDVEKAYGEELVNNKYGKLINFYSEKTSKFKNAITGKSNYGYPKFLPIQSADGKEINDESAGYTFNLITCRDILMTKARTISNYYLLQILPENFILINPKDAQNLSLTDGDSVRLTSASNTAGEWDLKHGNKKPVIGKVKVSEGIRPGVISFTLGHGRWGDGAMDITVNNDKIPADKRRQTGIHANAVMRLDPLLSNTSLSDLTGASVSFYDTKVKITKV